jgi:release factor glutamine methyltransferase
MPHLNIWEAQDALRRQLSAVSNSAYLDAQVLLASIIDKPRAWVIAYPEYKLEPSQVESLHRVLDRLESGEPMPYILGQWEFYGLDFIVTPAVLIPRPETELLVDYALNWLRANPDRRRAADVGTGSGCIAIALAANISDLTVVASDISMAALDVARHNIAQHRQEERIHLVQADLLSTVSPSPEKKLDLVCANLPYIPQGTLDILDRLRWEPETALSGGESGTEFIQRLLAVVPLCLNPGGLLLLEIEASQGALVRGLAQEMLTTSIVSLERDLAGHDRLVVVHT